MQIQIAKFGGSSLNEAQFISKAADIIQNSPVGLVTVVSAMGGITDLLLKEGKNCLFLERHQEAALKLARISHESE